MKNTYKCLVSYDGTDYEGWQSQRNGRTVAEALEKAFVDFFKVPVTLCGVSRTDSGVHAMGQVVRLRTDLYADPEKLAFAWNNRLGCDIVVRDVQKVESDFKLHAEVVEKTYFYHFFTSRPHPFIARYGWHFPYKIDIEKLKECLQVFVGTHDFRSFCTGDDWDNTVRTINSIEVEDLGKHGAYRIVVKGPKFLRYMVRRIVGSCIQVASNSKLKVEYLREVMLQKNPENTLLNAPPKGLMLYKIQYEKDLVDEGRDTFQLF